MLVGNELWSLVSLAVAFLTLGLGIYVVRANPNARVATVFFLVMVLMFVGGSIDFLFMNSPDREHALVLARVLLFLLVVEMGAIFYLATFLPYERASGWFRDRWWIFFSVVCATAVVPAYILEPEDLLRTSYGWGVQSSLALGTWSAIVIFYSLSADVMLAFVSQKTEDRKVRAQIGIVAIATTVPVIYGLAQDVLEQASINLPPILSPGYFLAAIIMAWAVLRYRLFAIEVLDKVKTTKTNALRKDYGLTMLYFEKKGSRAFDAFIAEMGTGSVGAVISRIHPDIIRENFHLQGVPLIWLAQQPGESRIDPTNLGILQHSILEFYRKHEGSVVLLEGIEYLLANNSLESVLKTLYALDDEVVVRRGLLIITVDPEILTEQGVAMLVRDFQLVE